MVRVRSILIAFVTVGMLMPIAVAWAISPDMAIELQRPIADVGSDRPGYMAANSDALRMRGHLVASAPDLAQTRPRPQGADPILVADATAAAPAQPGPSLPSGDRSPIPIGPHAKPIGDISAWSMFMDADILVKAVMVALAFASVLTWTIFLGKTLELLVAKARLNKSLQALEGCGSLHEAQMMMARQHNVTAVLIQQAVQETRLSADIPNEAGLRERVASRFGEVQKSEGRIIRRGIGLLATIGSTAPFVGLFGTVWGIMNSFIGIAKSQTTNLAVVAPGIAEALLATAIGLVAAIPAVIVYNHFTRATKGYMDAVGRAAGAVGRLLSRDLDRARGRPPAQAKE